MRLLPDSYRKRVRLLWGSLVAAPAVGLLLAAVLLGNTGHSIATPIDPNQPAQIIVTPKTVRASGADRRAAESVLSRFVLSAFIRRNLASSWPLATPHMKIGTPRSDWLHGFLPVSPYPAGALKRFGLTPKYSYKGILGYDVLMIPNETSVGKKTGQQVYACELHDAHGSWLVDFCYLRASL